MSQTIVKKHRRKVPVKTPAEIAEECDEVQARLRADMYRRKAERERREAR